MSLAAEARERKVGLEARLEDQRLRQNRELHEMRLRHESETGDLLTMLDALDKVIAFEDKTIAFAADMDVSGIKPSRQPLPEYLFRQIRLLKRATKDDLRSSAARQGFFAEGDNGGRSVHASLLNLQRGGKIREVEANSGIYEIAPAGAFALFADDALKENAPSDQEDAFP